ncbi:MAG TPA: ferric reductase-like transmembrane domain-containing protein [Rhodoblastus sp.]|nr:ferric reductase-like transmembrane domain-containing protein [Rhodoblastus sp.]
MSAGFAAIGWNRKKVVYDLILLAAVVLFIGVAIALDWRRQPPANAADICGLWIRASGACAFLMLTLVLCIGPLARLSPAFLPLLYNRRHFGVLTCIVALTHFAAVIGWYIADGHPFNLLFELTKWSDYASFSTISFKAYGFVAFLILLLLAATSHDYWLAFLTPPVWKAMHMLVYLAFGLMLVHVAKGLLQDERDPWIAGWFADCFALVAILHIVAGWREAPVDRGEAPRENWIRIGPPSSIPDKRARIVAAPNGERIAVFRDGDEIGAVTNLCAHQNGPLGEGRIVDGCIVCPWHGYEYRLTDGCAPAPFKEKLATFSLRLNDGLVEVDPRALPPGTPASIRIERA